MVREIHQGIGLLELVQLIDSLLCCFSVGNVPENVLQWSQNIRET